MKKDGFSVHEIEQFGKAHKFTLFFSALFLLAGIFNAVFWDSLGPWLAALAAIAGVCFPNPLVQFLKRGASLASGQEKSIRMIFAGVAIALAIVFPPVYFLAMGMVTGIALHENMDLFKGSQPPANTPSAPEE